MRIKLFFARITRKLSWRFHTNPMYYARRVWEKMRTCVVGFTYYPDPTVEIINKVCIRIVGLSRSGNHAIINWISSQTQGRCIFFNNVRADESPFQNYIHAATCHQEHWRLQELKTHNPDYDGKEGLELLKEEAKGNFLKKDFLMVSFEDCSLKKIARKNFVRAHDRFMGKSEAKFEILILRDPFNLFASRIRFESSRKRQLSRLDPKDASKLWIQYAIEFLGETNYLGDRKLCINYNRWVVDSEYRASIARQLDIKNTDAGINNVPKFGGGSSFDGIEAHGQASKMDVFGRWKSYVDDPYFRSIMSDKQLIKYSERIFGHIPGTELLL